MLLVAIVVLESSSSDRAIAGWAATRNSVQTSVHEIPMAKTRPSEDIRSLSEFRANVAGVLRQVKRRRRPVFLTQHGRGTAVLMDAAAYEELVEELELLRDVHQAEK